jgi:hypothetical protein
MSQFRHPAEVIFGLKTAFGRRTDWHGFAGRVIPLRQ